MKYTAREVSVESYFEWGEYLFNGPKPSEISTVPPTEEQIEQGLRNPFVKAGYEFAQHRHKVIDELRDSKGNQA